MSQTKAAEHTDAARAPKSIEANAPATSTEKAAPPRASDTLALKLSSPEFTSTLSHFHRAEIARMAGWRDRLDRTSNWAITVVAAMLSVSLSTPSAHHGVLLFAMLLITLLLWIEARRYRFFDVYRTRVRQFERYYFAQIFSPQPDFASNWLAILGEGLRSPRFLISQRSALIRRLRRNYIFMYTILMLAWVLKITTPSLAREGASIGFSASLLDTFRVATLGPIPGVAVVCGVAVFYLAMLAASFFIRDEDAELSFGDVHV
ncbi:DUF2270 domain-containing protein [Mesorhizobium sp. M2D.F.Ca.ET.185.01.1.1]|uniref:DUF2270 domain-containing protein n=1 Tax=unclassified Mesorhizobium TaxID=325217 RepID=UPI000FCA52A9|nr:MULTISPECIES: DUF2270 domain-containing protein [unclassified Mesorhizobium]TGP49127.1 DUF2270 domain-containing protein [bacterium M00.F.Ca.ET.230.01.1.1]TGP79465.1 DUF2270 domain-containing protein [bacterium M00.F.Ca.ET.227.01.1.1]TGQ00796.1 DUF2270 domain-containing protein [bacterium M00.F.Ca.ET.221.01.1.1]TGQ02683.1 DUF2270 domain-containing protein [bacterium M00.F.Ca.ET.222.01.1.1]TGT74653.1 DUF2270 domain-containing protein [bacterium M00.F.Ca.ET.159.01.1.1]TGT86903.1 DUF2270 doma